jgi:hypothetical protein
MLSTLDENKVAWLRRRQAGDSGNLRLAITHEGCVEESGDVFERSLHGSCIAAGQPERKVFRDGSRGPYNPCMQRKIFWLIVIILEVATFWLPMWYQVFSIVPIVAIAWWVAYRSDWF